MVAKTNDFNIQMTNLVVKQPVTKKSAEPIESSLDAIQDLGRLDNKAAKSLAKKAQDLSKAMCQINSTDPMDNTLFRWSFGGEVVGGVLGLAVEVAMFASGVTSGGLVLGCTFGTMGVIWLIGTLAGIYFQGKETQSRRNEIEEQKSGLKELIAQNKEEITNCLTAKIKNDQRERDRLLSTELPAFSETNNDRADRMKKIFSDVILFEAIIQGDNGSLKMLSKF